MTKILLLITISLALCGSAAAQSPKASEQSNSVKAAKPAKQNQGRFLQSHSKQVGGFGPYQVHSLRIRGLDSPNVSAAIIYDPRSETYTVVGPATGAGLGSAILGAAGNVGSSAVFGLSLRPTRINENIDNSSESEGSSAKSSSEGGAAVSVSEGGDSTAISVSDADARSSSSSKNHNKVTSQNTNVNSNQQSQGQAQGQIQGQSNSNSNTNSRKNGNGPKDKD